MKFLTPFTYVVTQGKTSEKPSQTQPNQSMSIREILHRYATGKPIPVNKNLVYGGSQWFPDPETLDLTEREVYYNEAKERVKALEEKAKTEQDEHKLAVQEEELKKWKELSDKFKPVVQDKKEGEGGTTTTP